MTTADQKATYLVDEESAQRQHVQVTEKALRHWDRRRHADTQTCTLPVHNIGQFLYRLRALFLAMQDMETEGRLDITQAQVLDVGAANGYGLRPFLLNGLRLDQLHGVDLFQDRVDVGHQITPGIDLRQGDGTQMGSFADGQFDVCCEQFCFCHVPDDQAKVKMAAEMLRVTRPGGFLIIHDWKIGSRSRLLYGMSRKKIATLFDVGRSTQFFHRYPSQLFPVLGRPISRFLPSWYTLAMSCAPFLVGSWMTVLRRL